MVQASLDDLLAKCENSADAVSVFGKWFLEWLVAQGVTLQAIDRRTLRIQVTDKPDGSQTICVHFDYRPKFRLSLLASEVEQLKKRIADLQVELGKLKAQLPGLELSETEPYDWDADSMPWEPSSN